MHSCFESTKINEWEEKKDIVRSHNVANCSFIIYNGYGKACFSQYLWSVYVARKAEQYCGLAQLKTANTRALICSRTINIQSVTKYIQLLTQIHLCQKLSHTHTYTHPFEPSESISFHPFVCVSCSLSLIHLFFFGICGKLDQHPCCGNYIPSHSFS